MIHASIHHLQELGSCLILLMVSFEHGRDQQDPWVGQGQVKNNVKLFESSGSHRPGLRVS